MPAVAVGVVVSMCMVTGFRCSREMHLIILWLYYPCFSTTSIIDCSVTCGEYNQAHVTYTVNSMAMCFLLRVFVTVLFVRDWIPTNACAIFPPPVQILQSVSVQLSASMARMKTPTVNSRPDHPACLHSCFIVKYLLGLFFCLRSLHFGSTQKYHP